MIRVAGIFVLVSLVLAGCRLDDDVETDIVLGLAGDQVSVTVSDGPTSKLRPYYTWSLGSDTKALQVTVSRVSKLDVEVWEVVSKQAQDDIGSGVEHGNVPLNAFPTAIDPSNEELALETGIPYRVTVTKKEGASGFREFSIKP